MKFLGFILQSSGRSSAFEAGQSAGFFIGLGIMALMVLGGVYVLLKYPRRNVAGILFGLVLCILPFTGWILAGLFFVMDTTMPEDALLAIPLAWAGWLVIFIYAHIVIHRGGNDLTPHETFDSPNEEREYDTDLIDADLPQIPETTPRRAVRIPATNNDSARESEQTLKRMTLDKLESERPDPKGPRAGEIPENPILPDELVKVRCLACDKKMQAEGAKFMKQRRCPNCKAAPFRYVTAV